VEILRGEQMITARVVWSAAGRSGLRSEDRLPVEDILSAGQSRALQLVASEGVLHDRRRRHRAAPADARHQARAIEFVAVAAIALTLVAGTWTVVQRALQAPLARVSAVLG
jgi:hypothetical protein